MWIVLTLAGAAMAADQDSDGFDESIDCDDADGTVFPGAVERCNGVDDDCAGGPDDGLGTLVRFVDRDLDGWGAGPALAACVADDPGAPPGALWVQTDDGPVFAVEGYSELDSDCNDFNGNLSPDAVEVCDLQDNDCNGFVDDSPIDGSVWFVDEDGDGFGAGQGELGCPDFVRPQVELLGDCDDSDVQVNPGADEVCANGLDEDCSGAADDGLCVDPASKPEEGCGCAATPGPGAWGLGGLALLLVARRRRISAAG